jgi:hypothetical protein
VRDGIFLRKAFGKVNSGKLTVGIYGSKEFIPSAVSESENARGLYFDHILVIASACHIGLTDQKK